MTTPREIQLIYDHLPGECKFPAQPQRPQPCQQHSLPVPTGVSFLIAGEHGEWQLSQQPAEDDGAFVLEPIWGQPQPKLLVIAPAGRRPRVNGREAPPLALLAERDQFQPDPHSVLHVAIYNRPQVGPPTAQRVGTECPICRTRFEADTRVYTCVNCGATLHLQGEETPPELRLECALAVRECPVCRCRIEMNEGFSYKPERYCD